jgi:hypothetical protein
VGGSNLSQMEESDLAFELTGSVNASPDAVMEWWYDPERLEERRTRLEETGSNVSLEVEDVDGIRVTTSHLKDRRGWRQSHRVESHLGPNGRPAQQGDRYIARSRDVARYKPPLGKGVAVSCEGQIEFIPQATGGTEIVVTHRHSVSGGLKNWQRSIAKGEHVNTATQFQETLGQCQAALAGISPELLPDE